MRFLFSYLYITLTFTPENFKREKKGLSAYTCTRFVIVRDSWEAAGAMQRKK